MYLPPGFSHSDPWRYPTLYLQDGQNVFDEKSAVFGVEWGVDEAAEKLILQGRLKGIIVVAVANTPNRIDLYTPFPDAHHGGGNGALYRDFFIDELKPWVDREYPTSNRATDTAVAGSSLGGLCSLYISWSRPAVLARSRHSLPLCGGQKGSSSSTLALKRWRIAGQLESGLTRATTNR